MSMFEFHNTKCHLKKNTLRASSILPRTLHSLKVKSFPFEALIQSIVKVQLTYDLRTSLITFCIHFIKSYIFARHAIYLHDTVLHHKHETIRENAPLMGMCKCT